MSKYRWEKLLVKRQSRVALKTSVPVMAKVLIIIATKFNFLESASEVQSVASTRERLRDHLFFERRNYLKSALF